MQHHSSITKEMILAAVKLFGFVTRQQLALYFTNGQKKRIKALEALFPELEKEGELTFIWHEGRKLYMFPRKNRAKGVSFPHEEMCTGIYIRLWKCRMEEAEIVPVKAFTGFQVRPDGGLRFSFERKSMLLFEYSTGKNYKHGVLKGKLTRYRATLSLMENRFDRVISVLFVVDIDRKTVREFVYRMKPLLLEPVFSEIAGKGRYPFFFIDAKSFTEIPLGSALTEALYFWHDGKEWPLTNHA